MVGQSEVDPALCRHYALFASSLDQQQFGTIYIVYWSFFGVNLFILFLGSSVLISGQRALKPFSTPSEIRTRLIRKYLLLCAACILASLAVVIVQAMMLLALQFCVGENLISIYWSSWTTIQVGSLVAILGIALAQIFLLWDYEHPPWGLALGTPVLVIAGILNLSYSCMKRSTGPLRPASSTESDSSTSKEENIESAPKDALNDDEKMQAEIIGSTIEGGPIVRFLAPLASSRHKGEILGYSGERPIVAYRKGLVSFRHERASSLSSEHAWSDTTECPSIKTPDLASERLAELISQYYKSV